MATYQDYTDKLNRANEAKMKAVTEATKSHDELVNIIRECRRKDLVQEYHKMLGDIIGIRARIRDTKKELDNPDGLDLFHYGKLSGFTADNVVQMLVEVGAIAEELGSLPHEKK